MIFLVAGDANADMSARLPAFPHEGDDCPLLGLGWHSGGSAANVATTLARMGAAARLLSRVGVDPAGPLSLRAARAAGVDLACVQQDETLATGLYFAAVSPGGERTFFSHRGANVALAAPPLPAAFHDAGWLHVGGHALIEGRQRETALALVAEAGRRGVPVSLDLCLPLLRRDAELVAALSPHLAVLFANAQETAALAGAPSHTRAPLVVVEKLGAAGARVRMPAETVQAPAFEVGARDTTACGDAFVAGFLLATARGAPPAVAARLGNALGALTATRPGAADALPSREEVRAFLAARGARAELSVLEGVPA
jgi:sugar/nucleoside kinase (ribokinase family)